MNDDHQTQKIESKEYEQLGRLMTHIVEGGYVNHKRLVWLSFVRGLFIGFGSVIGATVLIAALVWVLSFFDSVPVINDLSERIDQSSEVNQ